MDAPRTLLLAWGNQGRGDDGLGPALAELLAERAPSGLTVSSDYQLQVEDAHEAAGYPRVIFADADRAGPEPFSFRRLAPAASSLSFSSHSVTPGGLLALTAELFDRRPEAWLLGIRGYEFDRFEESLSPAARENLAAAADFLAAALESGRFDETPPATLSEVPPGVGRTPTLTVMEGVT